MNHSFSPGSTEIGTSSTIFMCCGTDNLAQQAPGAVLRRSGSPQGLPGDRPGELPEAEVLRFKPKTYPERDEERPKIGIHTYVV